MFLETIQLSANCVRKLAMLLGGLCLLIGHVDAHDVGHAAATTTDVSSGSALNVVSTMGNSVEPAPMTLQSQPHAVMSEREARAEQSLAPAIQRSLKLAQQLSAVGDLQTTVRSALIIYDLQRDKPFGQLDYLYAILLKNVLSHFVDTVTLVGLQDYESGDTEFHDATFYLGAWTDEPLPVAFASDVLSTKRTFVWVYGNLSRLTKSADKPLSELFGFSIEGHALLNQTATVDNPYPGFYDAVLYKGHPFVKHFDFDPATGVVEASPGISEVLITDADRALAHVEIGNIVTGEIRPWLVQSQNFWFIAERPLTYNHVRDRYLVLCDMLHDILGVRHEEKHQALVRLEDIDSRASVEALDSLSVWFEQKEIPFAMAVIPEFRDPLGNSTASMREASLDDLISHPLVLALKRAQHRGGSIVMHGVTHQYGKKANPFSGVSGMDYEFFDYASNAPHAEDSLEDHRSRLNKGRSILSALDMAPFAFETPHYLGSPRASRAVAELFGATYQRGTYFTDDDPDLNCDDATCDLMMGQFFPFLIPEDFYGQRVIPENLGNLQYTAPQQPAEYLVKNAEYGLTVRDGFASFFFHPALLGGDRGKQAEADLHAVIEGITKLGYLWVDPASLAHSTDSDDS